MMVLVNVFAIISAALFVFKLVSPLAFLVSSALWFLLMLAFWFLLPNMIYKKSPTFRDRFRAVISEAAFTIENERGSRSWQWNEFYSWTESPYFFHVYFSQRSFLIIPKEAFKLEELNSVRQLLNKQIGNSKAKIN